MTLAAEKEMTHLGETCGCADHDHDLVHDLSRRLDALWRYDQYIANAEWRDEIAQFWRDAKAQEPILFGTGFAHHRRGVVGRLR